MTLISKDCTCYEDDSSRKCERHVCSNIVGKGLQPEISLSEVLLTIGFLIMNDCLQCT